jgi:nicotinamidase-related amidase
MPLEPTKTALLTLDFQSGIFASVTGSESMVPRAAEAVDFARQKHIRIIHVGLGFSDGHPEISDRHPTFRFVKQKTFS